MIEANGGLGFFFLHREQVTPFPARAGDVREAKAQQLRVEVQAGVEVGLLNDEVPESCGRAYQFSRLTAADLQRVAAVAA